MGNHKLYLYPVWIRLWHLLNALLCLVLLCTGAFMHFESNILDFSTSVRWHNIAGIIFILNYMIFLIGNLFTKNGDHYAITFKGLFDRLIKQFTYYTFGVFKGDEAPFPVTEKSKFNPLQQIAYYSIMYVIIPIISLTGIALLFPEVFSFEIFKINGLVLMDFIHLLGGFIIVLFLIIHLYFSTLGEKVSTHFKSIINGWH